MAGGTSEWIACYVLGVLSFVFLPWQSALATWVAWSAFSGLAYFGYEFAGYLQQRRQVEETKTLLRRTPPVLDALLRGLPETWVRENEGPETWSSFDVVGHLIEAEETNWIPRARHLITHGESAAFPPFDRFAFVQKWKGRSMADALDEFASARARSLRDLDALRLMAADLARRGRHPDFGSVTLGQLLATWAIHDLNHLGQIVNVLARQHTAAVGPWRAFLGILEHG